MAERWFLWPLHRDRPAAWCLHRPEPRAYYPPSSGEHASEVVVALDEVDLLAAVELRFLGDPGRVDAALLVGDSTVDVPLETRSVWRTWTVAASFAESAVLPLVAMSLTRVALRVRTARSVAFEASCSGYMAPGTARATLVDRPLMLDLAQTDESSTVATLVPGRDSWGAPVAHMDLGRVDSPGLLRELWLDLAGIERVDWLAPRGGEVLFSVLWELDGGHLAADGPGRWRWKAACERCRLAITFARDGVIPHNCTVRLVNARVLVVSCEIAAIVSSK